MATYRNPKYKHTITAGDHETTKRAIMARDGWVIVPQPEDNPDALPLAYVEKSTSKTDAELLEYAEILSRANSVPNVDEVAPKPKAKRR